MAMSQKARALRSGLLLVGALMQVDLTRRPQELGYLFAMTLLGSWTVLAANKVAGVRACLINEPFSAHQGVEDDDVNVICLGGRTTGPFTAWDILEAFLAAGFGEAPRFLRRLATVRYA